MRKDLSVKPDPADARIEAERPTAMRIFGEWALGKLTEDTLLYRIIVFSDDAYFWLNGYVNKQNYRFWSEGQPEALLKLPIRPEKVTVCCDLYADGIIGSYLFKDAANRNVTVNDIQLFFCTKCKSLTCVTCTYIHI